MLSRSVLSSCRAARRVPQFRALSLESASPSSSQAPPPPTTPNSNPVLNTAIILNRSPIITKSPTSFERAYFAYHSRIKRALHNPFPYEFYFKQGSLLEGKFTKEEEEREREAFGALRNAAEDASTTETQATQVAELLGEEEAVKPMPRVSDADKKSDVKSLDRKMERNLYLLLSTKDGAGKQVWRFPQGAVENGELLHEAAKRDLELECGKSMDTWVVSRNPIGVLQPSPSSGLHTFFYKAHILAGQVTPAQNHVSDFAWLTKQEIEPRVESGYWTGVKDMLSDF